MPWKIDGRSDDNSLVERDIQTKRLNKLHYVEGGNRDGLPVVLLHDNMTSSRWWEATQEQLPYRYHSFAPDLRGYGNTQHLPVQSLGDFADDLFEFVTALELPQFFLVGWGMGGGIAMQYATQHPETLVALCLVNSISPKGHRPPERTDQLDSLSQAIRSNNELEVSAYLRRHYFRAGSFPIGELEDERSPGTGPQADEDAFNYIMAGSMQAQNYNFQEQEGVFHVMGNFDLTSSLDKLTMPIFIIYSDEDKVIRGEERREVGTSLASDQYQRDALTMPGVGHSPMVEQPDLFIQALSGYLGRTNYQQVARPTSYQVTDRMKEADRQSGDQGYGGTGTTDIAYDNKNS